MSGKLNYKNIKGEKAAGEAASAPDLKTRARTRPSPTFILLAAMLALSATILIVVLLRGRPGRPVAAVETPPTLEGKHAGEEGRERRDERDQEGSVEVSDEIAELIGLRTEKVASGEIEESI